MASPLGLTRGTGFAQAPNPMSPGHMAASGRRAADSVGVAEAVDLSRLGQELAVPESLRRSYSVPPAARYDVSGRVIKPHDLERSLLPADEVKRRMQLVRQRQAEYDRFNALPRKLPDRSWSEAEFAAHLDEVLGDNDAKRAAATKLALHDAMAVQKAQRRHTEWTKSVYEPIAAAVAAGVDDAFPRIHRARREAHEDYLRAADPERKGGGHIFLDAHPGAGGPGTASYNPWRVNAHATVRAHVSVRDPLKAVLDKRKREAAMLSTSAHHATLALSGGASQTLGRSASAGRGGVLASSASASLRGGGGAGGEQALDGSFVRKYVCDQAPDRLDPRRWTRGSLETLPFGHFEAVEAAHGGVMNMAHSGRDTASSWRGYDFDGEGTLSRTATGRIREIDAEFPVGKRVEGYAQRKSVEATAASTVRHRIPGNVYSADDGIMTDTALLDDVRPAMMRTAK